MSDDEIMLHFLFHEKDPDLLAAFRELDNVDNLNNNPMALRKAGYEAARKAYLLGYKLAKKETQ